MTFVLGDEFTWTAFLVSLTLSSLTLTASASLWTSPSVIWTRRSLGGGLSWGCVWSGDLLHTEVDRELGVVEATEHKAVGAWLVTKRIQQADAVCVYFPLIHPTLQFSSVQSLSRVWLFATPWTAARQASPSITNSRSLLKLMAWSWWCHPTISSSLVPFSSCLQSFPASGSFPMSRFFASGGQSIGVQLPHP